MGGVGVELRRSLARDAGAASPARCIESLERLLVLQAERQLEAHSLTDGVGPVFLYGAGRHTWWLLNVVNSMRRVGACAILDDSATEDQSLAGLPVLLPERAERVFGPPRAVLLSTDAWQDSMRGRALAVFGEACVIVDLYENLPPGPYLRGEGAVTRDSEASLTRPTELALRRQIEAICPYLQRRRVGRVHLLGEHWQTWTAAQALAANGLSPVPQTAEADGVVVCDDAMEREGRTLPPGLKGEVLTLRTGERPWIDRSNNCQRRCLSDERVRILIRHDNHLGDVVLSQGVLPERIKTELYPNAQITFMTTRSAPSRHASASTGWCMDLIRENPWIDERICVGDRAAASGWDLEYTISDSGDLNDHVFDHHAMKLEMAPGRTDARVHLGPADRARAARVVDGARRPLIAVNMSLIGDRFRAWGDEPTRQLCRIVEEKLGGSVAWIGWVDWNGYRRLADSDGVLSVREQAAVLAECDIHIAAQGAGANLSAGVGTQTLSLTGCHPPQREGVAYFGNPYVEDPSRRHVELCRYKGEVRRRTYTRRRDEEWSLHESQARAELAAYARELWDKETPVARLPDEERWNRVRSLSVEDVAETLAAMLRARRDGTPTPGE